MLLMCVVGQVASWMLLLPVKGGRPAPDQLGPWAGGVAAWRGSVRHWLGGMPLGWQATWHLTGALQGVPGDLDAG